MSNKALLGGLLPFISNPVVLAVVGIGAVGLTIYEILSDKEDAPDNGLKVDCDGSEPFIKPLDNEAIAVAATAIEPLKTVDTTVVETVDTAVEEPNPIGPSVDNNAASYLNETICEDDLKKEMIRQAMSELGKRSAAARAKSKFELKKG
jgi:hypothetical protein